LPFWCFQILLNKWQFGKEIGAPGYFSTMCGGSSTLEDATHLFIHCDFFRQIWFVVHNWLGFILVTRFNISDHLTKFGSVGGFPKRKKDIIRLVWFSLARVLWKERNSRIHKILFTTCLTTWMLNLLVGWKRSTKILLLTTLHGGLIH